MTSDAWPTPRIVYSRAYNIGFLGIERLHPFDSRKYGRAWERLRRRYGRDLERFHVKPPRPVSRGNCSKCTVLIICDNCAIRNSSRACWKSRN